MKLLIYHGPGAVSLNNKLQAVKKGFNPLSIGEFSSRDYSYQEALNQIVTTPLFTDERLAILEDFSEVEIEKLPQDEHLTILLKYSKILPSNSKILKNLPKGAAILTFEEAKETSIFPFLDLLSTKNPKVLIELDKYLDEWGSQYVLTMLFYCLRRFLQAPQKLPPFVLKKIESQRINFSLERIKELYEKTLETDYKIKQGLLPEKMATYFLVESFLK